MLLKEESTFVNAPEGQYRAVCVDFVDLGMVSGMWDGKPRETHKCRVVFAIDAQQDDGKPFTIGGYFTVSMNEKANLRKFLESWRGRAFTAAELKGFETENLIGVNALIQIVHVTKGEKTYANINSIMSLPKGMKKLEVPKDYVRVKDRTPAPAVAATNGDYADFPAALEDDDSDDLPF